MFNNIMNAAIKNKLNNKNNQKLKIIIETNTNKKPLMIDKSTDTKDLEKIAKEKKILNKFKKNIEKKKAQSKLFSQVIGSPRNVEEIEDE